MTKKQFGIILTLMALIVCVGVLSMKLNEGGYNDPTDLGSVLAQNDDENKTQDNKEKETLSTQDYFYNMRVTKEQQDAKYVAEMKSITEDANASQENKDIANNALIEKTKLKDQESRVEQDIKNRGFEDAICMIDSNKVRIYIKVDEDLNKETSAIIQQVVEDITSLSDITITAKK
jgi:stage III sporulation protein AH